MIQHRSRYRLNVAALGLGDERLNEIATIIAEETEVQRERKRAQFPDTPPDDPNYPNLGLLGGGYSYANSLTWDVLLTFEDCVFRCAGRARIGVVQLLDFAREKCEPEEPWLLHWFGTTMRVLERGVDSDMQTQAIAKTLAEVEAKHQRIKAGARVGGQKSAQRRRQIQSTPSSAELLAERKKLIDGGMADRNVAAFQAKKYNVTAAAIRAAYKRN